MAWMSLSPLSSLLSPLSSHLGGRPQAASLVRGLRPATPPLLQPRAAASVRAIESWRPAATRAFPNVPWLAPGVSWHGQGGRVNSQFGPRHAAMTVNTLPQKLLQYMPSFQIRAERTQNTTQNHQNYNLFLISYRRANPRISVGGLELHPTEVRKCNWSRRNSIKQKSSAVVVQLAPFAQFRKNPFMPNLS